MPIRFRCPHCQGLSSIATRRAGSIVACPTCGQDVLVPEQDLFAASPVIPPLEESTASPQPAAEFADVAESPPAPPAEATPPVAAAPTAAPDAVAVPEPPAPPPPFADAFPLEEAFDAEEAGDAEEPAEPEFAFRRGGPITDEMDLTPMVDVVFQLLIFFMVTASFSLQKTIETPKPDTPAQGAAQTMQTLEDLEQAAILVRIDDQNGILLDDEPVPDPARLAEALRDVMRKEQKSEMIVTATAGALHRTVIRVIDAANEVGMQRIRMTAAAGGGE